MAYLNELNQCFPGDNEVTNTMIQILTVFPNETEMN